MAKKGKYVPVKGTVREALESVPGEITDLKDELQEWQSNLEGNGMEHLPKYDEVTEAADSLENVETELENAASELISALDKHENKSIRALLDDSIEWSEFQPYKGRSYSRADRCSNAIAPLQCAADHIKSEIAELVEDHGVKEDDTQEVFSYAEEVETQCEEAESICFPGMFG